MQEWSYPTRPRDGYSTRPDYDKVICKMTREELSAVEEFAIENEHGEISFFDLTDLVDVDLANDVIIK